MFSGLYVIHEAYTQGVAPSVIQERKLKGASSPKVAQATKVAKTTSATIDAIVDQFDRIFIQARIELDALLAINYDPAQTPDYNHFVRVCMGDRVCAIIDMLTVCYDRSQDAIHCEIVAKPPRVWDDYANKYLPLSSIWRTMYVASQQCISVDSTYNSNYERIIRDIHRDESIMNARHPCPTREFMRSVDLTHVPPAREDCRALSWDANKYRIGIYNYHLNPVAQRERAGMYRKELDNMYCRTVAALRKIYCEQFSAYHTFAVKHNIDLAATLLGELPQSFIMRDFQVHTMSHPRHAYDDDSDE